MRSAFKALRHSIAALALVASTIKPAHSADPENADLVFIHGYGGSNCSWNAIAAGAQEFATPEYIELVGFGSNSPHKDFDFSVESQAQHLAETLKRRGLEDATLVAHSFGAATLLAAMLNYDVHPKRVVFVDPLAYPQDLPFFLKAQTIPIISPLISQIASPAHQVDIALKAVFFDINKVDQPIRDCYIAEFDIPFHRTALRQTALQLASFDAEAYVKRYNELSTEFHIIWGSEDPLISAKNMPQLSRDLRAKTATSIANCGHAPHEECPAKFLDAMNNILDAE